MIINCGQIAECLKEKNIEFEVHGENREITKLSALAPDLQGCVCYYVGDDETVFKGIQKSIIICRHTLEVDFNDSNTYIFSHNPQLCFYHVSSLFKEEVTGKIHPMSQIDSEAVIGKNVSIGPFCDIEKCRIGDDVVIHSGIKIHKGAYIGNGVRINSNSVIGEAGIMWVLDGKKQKIHLVQTGTAIIGDNVFIGSHVRVVGGAFENTPTIIEKNALIGNGTSISHGGFIGENTHIANNATLAGTVRIGKNCFLGSACCIRPHVSIPDNTVIGLGAVVVKSYSEEGLILAGNPAKEMKTTKEKLSGIPPLS